MMRRVVSTLVATGTVWALVVAPALADAVVADDLIVQGNVCAGFDCVDGNAFGSSTVLELKENNTRVGFADTSSGSEPAVRWELTANDSASGGLNYLQILQTSGGGGAAFRVLAGAGTDTLAVRAAGTVLARGSVQQRVDGATTSAGAALPGNLLAGLADVGIDTYVATGDAAGGRHVRVDAGNLGATYGIGDGTDVSVTDVVGLALAASQALANATAAATPGAAGAQGAPGDAGARGPAGRDGRDGTTDPDADEQLRRRLSRLSAQQANLTISTTVLSLRAGAVRRGIRQLPTR